MEPSPLTQQARPDTFIPKIAHLYTSLLLPDDDPDHDPSHERPPGFWREFFLLKPEPAALRKLLGELTADEILATQGATQQLFAKAVERVGVGNESEDENALDTLCVFLQGVLQKKYTNPSSDIIGVLAGLDHVDRVLGQFVAALDTAIKSGRNMTVRQKAIRVALTLTAGAYQTGLISYMTHRDLFPALVKVIQDSEHSSQVVEPFILLGLLANYNKFEFQNPYRLRLDDFVNDNTIRRIVYAVGLTCGTLRDEYIAIQDDTPEAWGLGSALGYFGWGGTKSASRPVTPGEDAQKEFGELPSPAISILLATYDFVDANKLFGHNLVTLPAETKGSASPLSGFLSLSSYLFQHAHRSQRATLYTYLTLFILQILVEDQVLMKRLCSDESKMNVRLCRQRAPHLPLVKGDRIAIVFVIEVAMDCINHNLRKRLDVDLYLQCTGILIRIISYLSRSRTRLHYHWAELWRSLLSFIRFLTTYASDLRNLPSIEQLASSTVNLIALSLSSGEAFLPDAAAYDDLFYKLVETGDHLIKFRDAYNLSTNSAPKTPSARDDMVASGTSIDTLLSVSEHYHNMLESEGKKGSAAKNLSPKEVSKIITQGYESLSIQAKDGLDRWEKFREADYKSVLKRVARVAVVDVRSLAELS